jgi:hypothetical protein
MICYKGTYCSLRQIHAPKATEMGDQDMVYGMLGD